MGYLPEAMRNYLARLGWGHGDDELFSDAQAIDWFDVADVVGSPARLDWAEAEPRQPPLHPPGRRRAAAGPGRSRCTRAAACIVPRGLARSALVAHDPAGEGGRQDHPRARRPDPLRAAVRARSSSTTRPRACSTRRRGPARAAGRPGCGDEPDWIAAGHGTSPSRVRRGRGRRLRQIRAGAARDSVRRRGRAGPRQRPRSARPRGEPRPHRRMLFRKCSKPL